MGYSPNQMVPHTLHWWLSETFLLQITCMWAVFSDLICSYSPECSSHSFTKHGPAFFTTIHIKLIQKVFPPGLWEFTWSLRHVFLPKFTLRTCFKDTCKISVYMYCDPSSQKGRTWLKQKQITTEPLATTTTEKLNDSTWHIKHKVTLYGAQRYPFRLLSVWFANDVVLYKTRRGPVPF